MWRWKCHFTSLSFSFLNCEMEIMPQTLQTNPMEEELNYKTFSRSKCIFFFPPSLSQSGAIPERKWPKLEKLNEKAREEMGLICPEWIIFIPNLPPSCMNLWLCQKKEEAHSLLSWAAGSLPLEVLMKILVWKLLVGKKQLTSIALAFVPTTPPLGCSWPQKQLTIYWRKKKNRHQK